MDTLQDLEYQFYLTELGLPPNSGYCLNDLMNMYYAQFTPQED